MKTSVYHEIGRAFRDGNYVKVLSSKDPYVYVTTKDEVKKLIDRRGDAIAAYVILGEVKGFVDLRLKHLKLDHYNEVEGGVDEYYFNDGYYDKEGNEVVA